MLSSSPGDAVVHEGDTAGKAITAVTEGGTESGHGVDGGTRQYLVKAERRRMLLYLWDAA